MAYGISPWTKGTAAISAEYLERSDLHTFPSLPFLCSFSTSAQSAKRNDTLATMNLHGALTCYLPRSTLTVHCTNCTARKWLSEMFHAFLQFSLGILLALSQWVVGRERLTLIWSIQVVLIQLPARKKLKGAGLRSTSWTARHRGPNPRQSPSTSKTRQEERNDKTQPTTQKTYKRLSPKGRSGSLSSCAPGLGCGGGEMWVHWSPAFFAPGSSQRGELLPA